MAVEISPEAREALHRLTLSVPLGESSALGSSRRGPLRLPVRWTRAENYHVTLRFLGDLDPDAVDPITADLQTALAEVTPFRVALGGTGCFPPHGAPRVLWVGIERGDDALVRVAAQVDLALAAHGFPPQNPPLSPHVTVGRVNAGRGPATLEIARRFLGAPFPALGSTAPEFEVAGVSLIESRLSPSGPRYFNLAKVAFDARS
ncbi:MAG: RNA 2',3'-cyclic phosphodiesterase [Planctomycetota bacterium]